MPSSLLVKWLIRITLLVLVVVGAGTGWFWWTLNSSLPILEGERVVAGITDDVIIERDAHGVPTIHGGNRADIAFALGLLHAQERFFQMDLLRRNSAGELSALFGAAAVSHDRRIRVHQFRKRAQRALAAAKPHELRLLEAYAGGVNAGLTGLDERPFEYLMLRADPEPWRPADTLLVLYSMYLDLQPEWNEHERSLAVLRDLLPADWYRFLTPAGGEWDSPIHGRAYARDNKLPAQPLAEFQFDPSDDALASNRWHYRDGVEIGSNNWSVAGSLTANGAGMVANDMHLGLGVPNIWYRASWYLPADGRRITGVTLPGAPTLVVGSNECIAWGFTNAYGDFHDSIILQTNADNSEYLTADGWQAFAADIETVAINGEASVDVSVRLTQWGPVIGEDHNGNLLALRWVAHDVEGANLNSLALETANTVFDALDIAAASGVPGQNFNVVDREGNQAWTIMGRLPRRVGFAEATLSPTLPADWSNGNLAWDGYLTAAEYPRVVNPADGRLWTANARVVSDELLDKVGHSDYALGARQQQIQRNLSARQSFNENDLLAIALDDRALFLERWRNLLLDVLDESINDNDTALIALHEEVNNWEGRASKTSTAYRIVKHFREQVIDYTIGDLLRGLEQRLETNGESPLSESSPRVFWPWRVDNMVEYPVWDLITQQPARHVPREFKSWAEFLAAMARRTAEDLMSDGEPLAEQTWGEANRLAMRHPLSGAAPFLSALLDMPAEPMDGDIYMPRVQGRGFGASERMVVSPGREEEGIFHMPGGQSAHPLSPYHDRGHRDWVEGKPSSFLPGDTKWRLELHPQ